MNNHRLGYQRLAEALVERGLIASEAVKDALAAEKEGGPLFTDALIEANLVSDWELSHVVSQLYALPFLNVDMVEPDPEAQEGLDLEFLWENGLVPLTRQGQVVTLCMPAIVPAEVLGYIAADSDLLIVVVVGTVVSNRRWITNNTQSETPKEEEPIGYAVGEVPDEDSEWGSLFDEADAAVLLDLNSPEGIDVNSPDMDLSSLPSLDPPQTAAPESRSAQNLEKVVKNAVAVPLPPPLPRKEKSNEEPIL
jgi:hypothetical protein